MTKPINTWDAENKIATWTIIDDKGRKFVGIARCHPDDLDFGNEIAGTTIASYRAIIKYLKSVQRDVLEPELAALKQLYYSINKSKQFNPHSYETRMLQRQIRMKNEDLTTIKEELASVEQNLKSFILTKDLTYKKLRENRAKKNQQDENN